MSTNQPLNGTLLYQLSDPRTAAMFAPVWDDAKGNWTILDNIKVWFNEAGIEQGVNGSIIPGVNGYDASYGSLTVGYGVGVYTPPLSLYLSLSLSLSLVCTNRYVIFNYVSRGADWQ